VEAVAAVADDCALCVGGAVEVADGLAEALRPKIAFLMLSNTLM